MSNGAHRPSPGETRTRNRLAAASLLTLLALSLFVWSILDPRSIPVIVAMSVGQAIGTLAFAIFLWVIVSDALFRDRGPQG